MARRIPIRAAGRVVEALANDVFLVQLDNGQHIRAHLAGLARTKLVRVLPGDRVEVEVSELDLSRGRILGRLRL